MIKVFCSLFFALVTSCAIKPASQEKTFLDEGYNCTWNESNTYFLCQKDVDASDKRTKSLKITEYYIRDANKTEVIRGELRRGSISWYDDLSTIISQPPGILREGQDLNDYKKIFLVESKEYIPLKKYQLDRQ